MRVFALLCVLVLALAGCGAKSDVKSQVIDENAFKGLDASASATTGAIRGVVVDTGIHPITKVEVSLASPTGNRTAMTDAQGRFVFSNVEPGTHFLRATHFLYQTAQIAVEVVAGLADPTVTKVQMVPLFSQTPYHEQMKYKGLIECGYQAAGVTAPCVTDYSTILCAGGCVPAAHGTLTGAQGDYRAFNTTVGADWQTMVLEMIFDSNGQGTSDEMGMLISFQQRTAGDWFDTVEGKNPLLLRLEVGVKGASEQGNTRPLINATGNNDLLILGSIKAATGQQVGVGIAQTFEVIQTNFYNAKPPAGWSFVAGNEFPF